MGTNSNMILMALLTGVGIILSVSFVNHFFFHHQKAGVDYPVVGTLEGGLVLQEPEVPAQICQMLAEADVDIGATIAKANCAACHQFENPVHGQGPHLVNIVGRDKAGSDFGAYSAALKGFGGQWDHESLNQFLHKPSAYVPGTAMNFAGWDNSKSRQRANVVAYLYSISGADLPACPAAEEMDQG